VSSDEFELPDIGPHLVMEMQVDPEASSYDGSS
jgi:hypothetical protein